MPATKRSGALHENWAFKLISGAADHSSQARLKQAAVQLTHMLEDDIQALGLGVGLAVHTGTRPKLGALCFSGASATYVHRRHVGPVPEAPTPAWLLTTALQAWILSHI